MDAAATGPAVLMVYVWPVLADGILKCGKAAVWHCVHDLSANRVTNNVALD